MDSSITIPRGPERVRRRPAVIFGDDGSAGVLEALFMLLEVFIPECKAGNCKRLTLTRHKDDSITLAGDDRGLCLCHPAGDDTLWRHLFCELTPGPKFGREEDPGFPNLFRIPAQALPDSAYWYQMNLCGVQYACRFMQVRVHRDETEYTLRFEKGCNAGGLAKTPYAGETGTQLYFLPDPEVFTDIQLPTEALARLMRSMALLIPGLEVTFCCEKAGSREVYFYPEDIKDYLKGAPALFLSKSMRIGRERENQPEYKATLNLGLSFSRPGSLECYHENREMTMGGTHVQALYESICDMLEQELLFRPTIAQLQECLKLVVITRSKVTCWENGTRRSIANTVIRDMALDIPDEGFREYIRYHKEYILYLLLNG